MHTAAVTMISILVGTLVAPSGANAEPPRLTAHLRVDRTQYHPGEFVHLQGFVRNETQGPMVLPEVVNYRLRYARDPRLVEIHVVTPEGDEYVYEPAQRVQPKLSAWWFRKSLDAEAEMPVFDLRLRLTDGMTDWVRRDDASPQRPQLRQPGAYRLEFVYRVPQVEDAPGDAWMGTIRSASEMIHVRELPPEQRLDRPTDEQLAVLDRFLEQTPAHDPADKTFLEEALLRTENEGLAATIVERCHRRMRGAHHLVAMLTLRAGHRDQWDSNREWQLGIDGPYLETIARQTIERFEALAAPPEDRPARPPCGSVEATVAWLMFHPDETELRDRLVAVLQESARLRAVEVQPIPGDRDGRLPLGRPMIWGSGAVSPVIAWRGLLDLGVLHVGMTRNKAVAILGEPNQRRTYRPVDNAEPDEWIGWYLASPRQVNDGLSAEVRDGRIVAFRFFRG